MTVKDPAEDELTVRVEVMMPEGERVRLEVLKLAPLLLVVRDTTPAKLLRLDSVSVVEFEKPACTVSEEELIAKAKSASEPIATDMVTD